MRHWTSGFHKTAMLMARKWSCTSPLSEIKAIYLSWLFYFPIVWRLLLHTPPWSSVPYTATLSIICSVICATDSGLYTTRRFNAACKVLSQFWTTAIQQSQTDIHFYSKSLYLRLAFLSNLLPVALNHLTLWLMVPGGSMPHLQGLANNPYPEYFPVGLSVKILKALFFHSGYVSCTSF